MSKPSTVYRCSDSGNAELFAALYKGRVLYDHLRGRWMIWNGVRWRQDDDGEIRRLASTVPRERRRLAEAITDDEVRRKVLGWSLQSESSSRLEAMLKLASSERIIADNGKSWDGQPMLLGCENGTLDLTTGKMLTSKPSMRVTRTTGIKFDPAAESPALLSTLEMMWPEQPEIISYVQRIFGYSMTGSQKEQAIFCFYGGGSNGKSTLLETVELALGEYAYAMPFSTIELAGRNSVPNDIAALFGIRYAKASETQEDIRLNEGRIKSLTGDTKLTARYLYHEPFTFNSTAKLHLAFNHKPRIYDDSYGFWRRLKLIYVNGVFDGTRVIKGFGETLATELPGILNWLIQGCLDWQKQGLAAPDAIIKATEEYRAESNPLQPFLDDRCVLAEGLTIPNADLWEEYLDWGRKVGEKYPLGRSAFCRRLEGKGLINQPVKRGDKSVRVWKGINTEIGARNPQLPLEEEEAIIQ